MATLSATCGACRAPHDLPDLAGRLEPVGIDRPRAYCPPCGTTTPVHLTTQEIDR